jgi:hypothetical protein
MHRPSSAVLYSRVGKRVPGAEAQCLHANIVLCDALDLCEYGTALLSCHWDAGSAVMCRCGNHAFGDSGIGATAQAVCFRELAW